MKDVVGIVLREKSYGESSKILDVLTKEYGLIGVIAKGTKKVKSSLNGVSNSLTYGTFHIYYKEGKLSTLTGVDIIKPFMNIKKDIVSISLSIHLLDIVYQVAKQTTNYSELFDLLISALIKINDKIDPLVITDIVELKLLSYLGVSPILNRCSVCGSKSVITLSSDKNGLICKNCRTYEKIVSKDTIKYIRMYEYLDISKISKVDMPNNVKNEIDDFLDNYYNSHTGIYLNSKKFINDLKKVNIYV